MNRTGVVILALSEGVGKAIYYTIAILLGIGAAKLKEHFHPGPPSKIGIGLAVYSALIFAAIAWAVLKIAQ